MIDTVNEFLLHLRSPTIMHRLVNCVAKFLARELAGIDGAIAALKVDAFVLSEIVTITVSVVRSSPEQASACSDHGFCSCTGTMSLLLKEACRDDEGKQ